MAYRSSVSSDDDIPNLEAIATTGLESVPWLFSAVNRSEGSWLEIDRVGAKSAAVSATSVCHEKLDYNDAATATTKTTANAHNDTAAEKEKKKVIKIVKPRIEKAKISK